jgi:predicted DNA-binding protein with PD1-like motif
METKFGDDYCLRLPKGAMFMEYMDKWAMKHPAQSFAATVIGVARDAELGFYDLDKRQYEWTKFDGMFEITGLVGNLAWLDGQPVWHVHGTFANRSSEVIGGHVRDFVVGTTCEVHLAPIAPMIRQFDDETGLNLLHVDE